MLCVSYEDAIETGRGRGNEEIKYRATAIVLI